MTFEEFETAYHRLFTQDPNRCVFLGVPERLGDLPDPSAEGLANQLAQADVLLGQVSQVDLTTLSFEQSLDIELARLSLQRFIFEANLRFNGRLDSAQRPTAGDDITNGIFFLFINDPRSPQERLDNILSRLKQVPEYLLKLCGRLDTPVQRWVEIELEKIEGIPSLLSNLVSWAASVEYADLDAFRMAIQEASAALSAYEEALRTLPTTTQFAVGVDAARALVKLRGIELSLEELHEIARHFLKKNDLEIRELTRELAARYNLNVDATPLEVQRVLNERFRVSLPTGRMSDVLERYQRERERILSYIKQHDLFPVLENQDMKIMETPAFMAPSIPAGAMFSPPPFRVGTRTSLVYLTLSEELIDEHTELSIPSMMIHEGIPGHHLQLATAACHPSVIRRHQDAMDQAEGWTTMLEDYMLDHGYLNDFTDEARFVAKRDIARIGARVAIDLFFMTGDRSYLDVGVDCDTTVNDPFAAAGNLLHKVTGFTPSRVQAELNWYSQERGYPLSYLTGNHLVWRLKASMRRHLKDQSEIEVDRAFHRTFLTAGNMPVSYLRRVFAENGLIAH